jgi:FMN phosphatase YigB (HAD superfamily)
VDDKDEPITTVLFDFAGTLFAPRPAEQQVAAAARELGVALSAHEREDLARQVVKAGMPGGPYPESVPEELRDLYARRDFASEAHRAAYVALMSTVAAPPGLAAALYERILVPDGWIAYSDAHESVKALMKRGVSLGLVSNVGYDLRPILLAHGMEQLARHATLSFEHGVAKPSPEIFRLALEDLRARPGSTLMVGDHPLADGGAAALGICTLILPMSPPGARHGLERVLMLVLRA